MVVGATEVVTCTGDLAALASCDLNPFHPVPAAICETCKEKNLPNTLMCVYVPLQQSRTRTSTPCPAKHVCRLPAANLIEQVE